jgi:tRNA modification GTPase
VIIGRRDTIAAIATPAGIGGVGIVRISGPEAVAFTAQMLHREPSALRDRYMIHGQAHDLDGNRLDDVLAVVMRAPHSFTGEDVAEIHGHGGALNMSRLLRAVLQAGARHAEAGEFTRRAFENGRLDLIRAEAIVDVIEASSERAWRLAQAQLDGRFGEHLGGFRARATELLAEVEACIDFPEEGEEYLEQLQIRAKALALGRELGALARTFTLGRALRDGIEVAIVGPVNAGKSSLFNALADMDRAIVDESPGTTRDFVDVAVVWRGIRVTLIDTAGDREAESRVEHLGITRGRERAAAADLQLRVHSANQPAELADLATHEPRVLHVLSKTDLVSSPGTEDTGAAPAGLLHTSARTGEGIDALRQAILDRVCRGAAESDDSHVVTSERHRALLQQAADAMMRVAEGVEQARPTEVLAIEIRDATHALAEIAGETVGDEVLDTLFRRFCIGK